MEGQHDVHPDGAPADTHIAASSTAILDCWSDHRRMDAVIVGGLAAFDRLIITTRNHTYEVVVTSPDDRGVLVRGGTLCPTFVFAHIVGSQGHGTMALGLVAVGCGVELEMEDGRWILTTPIETLAIVPAGATRHEPTASSPQ
jgi:hypothetical protein